MNYRKFSIFICTVTLIAICEMDFFLFFLHIAIYLINSLRAACACLCHSEHTKRDIENEWDVSIDLMDFLRQRAFVLVCRSFLLSGLLLTILLNNISIVRNENAERKRVIELEKSIKMFYHMEQKKVKILA